MWRAALPTLASPPRSPRARRVLKDPSSRLAPLASRLARIARLSKERDPNAPRLRDRTARARPGKPGSDPQRYEYDGQFRGLGPNGVKYSSHDTEQKFRDAIARMPTDANAHSEVGCTRSSNAYETRRIVTPVSTPNENNI